MRVFSKVENDRKSSAVRSSPPFVVLHLFALHLMSQAEMLLTTVNKDNPISSLILLACSLDTCCFCNGYYHQGHNNFQLQHIKWLLHSSVKQVSCVASCKITKRKGKKKLYKTCLKKSCTLTSSHMIKAMASGVKSHKHFSSYCCLLN